MRRPGAAGWVGGQGAVRGDVLEDLVDQVEYVWVVDGVDVPPPLAAGGDDPGQTELAEVLARGGDTHADARRQGADVVLPLCGQRHQVQPDGCGEHGEGAR